MPNTQVVNTVVASRKRVIGRPTRPCVIESSSDDSSGDDIDEVDHLPTTPNRSGDCEMAYNAATESENGVNSCMETDVAVYEEHPMNTSSACEGSQALPPTPPNTEDDNPMDILCTDPALRTRYNQMYAEMSISESDNDEQSQQMTTTTAVSIS